ncbi:MAG: hypothetical protein IJ489_11255 [Clostridia bacterium]|nr:hypothetical protein [Clostridia bacterium]
MKQSNPERKRQRRTTLRLLYLLLILVPLLSTATYTWFSLSRAPKVNTMALYINTPVGLEITWTPEDEESWGQNLNYAEYADSETILKPVTYSDKEKTFYAANFGFDGRMSDIAYALTDEQNANRDDGHGYYLKMTCYVRTDENVKVSLSRAYENSGTYLIGTPIWNSEEILHNDGGQGAQSAVRVGFKITHYDVDGQQVDEPKFIIYEPNCNYHINYEQAGQYIPTASIDGTENLISEDQLIRQSSTLWFEMDPVQNGVLVYQYGEFLDDQHLFDLYEDCMAKIEIYLWLEGQDIDCTNEIGKEAQIFANIQFYSENRPDSGMENIETNGKGDRGDDDGHDDDRYDDDFD